MVGTPLEFGQHSILVGFPENCSQWRLLRGFPARRIEHRSQFSLDKRQRKQYHRHVRTIHITASDIVKAEPFLPRGRDRVCRAQTADKSGQMAGIWRTVESCPSQGYRCDGMKEPCPQPTRRLSGERRSSTSAIIEAAGDRPPVRSTPVMTAAYWFDLATHTQLEQEGSEPGGGPPTRTSSSSRADPSASLGPEPLGHAA